MSVIVTLVVVPLSGRTGCIRTHTGSIKCYLKSAPEKGKANKELIKMLAKTLGIRQSDIEIIHGVKGRHKRIRIAAPVSEAFVAYRLGLA